MSLKRWRTGLLLGLCLSSHGAAGAPENVTIFVDGIDFELLVRSDCAIGGEENGCGAAPERMSNYLLGSPLANVLGQKRPSRQESVIWSGDPKGRYSVAGAVAATKTKILQAARANSRIDLITHSYGSVIAYTALAELSAASKGLGLPPRAIANFITLGSPLGQDALLSGFGQNYPTINVPSAQDLLSPEQLNIAGKWINVYASPDPIGGEIFLPGVVNLFAGAVPNVDPWNPVAGWDTALEAHKWPYMMPTGYGQVVNALVDSHAGLDRKLHEPNATSSAGSLDSYPPPSATKHPEVDIVKAHQTGVALRTERAAGWDSYHASYQKEADAIRATHDAEWQSCRAKYQAELDVIRAKHDPEVKAFLNATVREQDAVRARHAAEWDGFRGRQAKEQDAIRTEQTEEWDRFRTRQAREADAVRIKQGQDRDALRVERGDD